ncbi:MAG: hypothetical protein IKD30_01235, partial [Peptococcaceae bacterium]|nr:hypothetical protein [Peptococcaceae bacterium]
MNMSTVWTAGKLDLLKQFKSSEHGLSGSEAIQRLQQYGANQLQ